MGQEQRVGEVIDYKMECKKRDRRLRFLHSIFN
jgi:hypothetical protein